jgi:hypothetical protein
MPSFHRRTRAARIDPLLDNQLFPPTEVNANVTTSARGGVRAHTRLTRPRRI